MARIYFTRNFEYQPRPNVIMVYRAGHAYTVKRECADQAINGKCGIEEKPPRRRRKADPA